MKGEPNAFKQMTEAQTQAAAVLAAGPRGSMKDMFRPMLSSPQFTNLAQKAGKYIHWKFPLGRRINEMAALIGAARLGPAARMVGALPAGARRTDAGRRTRGGWLNRCP